MLTATATPSSGLNVSHSYPCSNPHLAFPVVLSTPMMSGSRSRSKVIFEWYFGCGEYAYAGSRLAVGV